MAGLTKNVVDSDYSLMLATVPTCVCVMCRQMSQMMSSWDHEEMQLFNTYHLIGRAIINSFMLDSTVNRYTLFPPDLRSKRRVLCGCRSADF